jgi:hypothetical protein
MADLSLRRCREEEGRRPGSGPGKQQFRGKQEKRLRSQVWKGTGSVNQQGLRALTIWEGLKDMELQP